ATAAQRCRATASPAVAPGDRGLPSNAELASDRGRRCPLGEQVGDAFPDCLQGVVLWLQRPERTADRLLAGPGGRNRVWYRPPFGLVQRPVRGQVLRPRALQRLGAR